MSAGRIIDARMRVVEAVVRRVGISEALDYYEQAVRSDQRARDFPTNNDAEDDLA